MEDQVVILILRHYENITLKNQNENWENKR